MDERRKSLRKDLTTTAIICAPITEGLTLKQVNIIIEFLFKKSSLKTRKTLNNIHKCIDNLEMSQYKDSPDMIEKLNLINILIDATIRDEMWNKDNLLAYVTETPNILTENQKKIVFELSELQSGYQMYKWALTRVNEKLEYGYVSTVRDLYDELMHSFDDECSYKELNDDLLSVAHALININRNTNTSGSTEDTFSLREEIFAEVIEDSLDKLRDRNRIFVTGMQGLNLLLSPGFMSKRLYTFLAFPSKGKSTMLLKTCVDIKKYNKDIKPKDPDKIPTVLMLTLENDIAETIERLYNMTTSTDDIRNMKAKSLIKQMREVGCMRITDDDPVDIVIKEYKNRSISTEDIYSIVNDMQDDGAEVIAIVLDYMKRIRPAEAAGDEKGELKNISNELKEIAKYFDVPVITAQQLNRSGATTVDAAIQAKKEDVTKLVGRDAIGGAWEILENSDWCCVINPETRLSDGKLFLTFKMLKRRYRSIEETEEKRRIDYINQPFVENSEIRLVDDVDGDPVYLSSLSTQFVPTEDKHGPKSATERPVIKNNSISSQNTINLKDPMNTNIDDDDFDPDKANY